ncbi:MFS transporter [Micromonospora sp. KC213]|uniref:MFS transporter n=1 Tax=Micromonospora sp. KC213 TaxID=2530378 RepID=UPI00104B66E1|nr:MFS transporter [Micromonospora sp. KC213]TDC44080.1 MFS transporter [Micromonospora sp. KC213]
MPSAEEHVARTREQGGGVSAGWLAVLAGPLSFGIAGPALILPDVARDLDLTPAAVTWIVTAFGWATAVGTPLMARLQSRRGTRAALVGCGTLVLLGGILTLVAPVLPVLVTGSALQGLGTAGLTTIAMSLARSARMMGLVTASLATVGSVAPLVGEVVAGLLGWRAALALPMLSLLAMPPVLRRRPVTALSAARFDLPGAALLTALVTALVFVPHVWQVATPAAVAAGLAFALWLRHRPDGFVPAAVVRSPAFLLAAGTAFLLAVVNFGTMYALPPLLAERAGWTGQQVGLAITWPLLFGGIASYVVIAVTARTPFEFLVVLFPLLAGAGIVLASLTAAPFALLGAQALTSVAAASGQGALATRAGTAVPEDSRAAAMGQFNLAYLLGAAFGPAIATLLLA